MQDYRDLKVWEKAHQFVLTVYKYTQTFPKEEKYGLKSQLRRAAASIPANIAEGAGRGTASELAQFIQIAAGSAGEADYLLYLCGDLDYIGEDEYGKLSGELTEIRKMLTALIKTLRSKN